MSTQQLVLFDIPSKAPFVSWSYNSWRTRLALNYKGIDYKTEWTEYPDLKPRLEKHLPGLSEYTVPTIILPSGEYIMDSYKIADVLEAAFPGTPSLHLDSPTLAAVRAGLVAGGSELSGVYVPLVPERLLGEASKPYFYRTRVERAGMPLDQFAREKGGDAAFAAAAPHFRGVTELLRERAAEGPFFLGATPSYADFLWGSFLLFYQVIGDDVFRKLLDATGDPALHLKLLKALEPWTERNDH